MPGGTLDYGNEAVSFGLWKRGEENCQPCLKIDACHPLLQHMKLHHCPYNFHKHIIQHILCPPAGHYYGESMYVRMAGKPLWHTSLSQKLGFSSNVPQMLGFWSQFLPRYGFSIGCTSESAKCEHLKVAWSIFTSWESKTMGHTNVGSGHNK